MGRGRAVNEGASYVARSIESEEDLRNIRASLGAMEGTLYKLSDNLQRAGEVKRQDSLERNIKTLNDGIKDLTNIARTRKGERIDAKEIQRLFGKAVSGMLKDIQSSSPIIDKKHISHGLDISPQDMDVLRKKFLNFISTTFTYLPHYKSSKPSAGFGADNELADDYNKLMDELISIKEREVKQADKAKALEKIELDKTKRLIKAKTEQTEAIDEQTEAIDEQTEAIKEETKEKNKVKGRRRKLGSKPLTPEQQSAIEKRAKKHKVAVEKEKANQRSISIQNAVVRLNMNNIKRAEEGAEEILSNMSQNKKPLNSFIHGMQRAMLRYANDEDKEELQAQSPYGQAMLKRLIPGIIKLSGAGPTDEDLASPYLYKNSKTGAEVKLPYSLQTAIDVINGKIQEVVSSVEDVVEKQEEVVKAVQESTTVMERVVSKDGKFEKVDGKWRRIQREDGKQPPTLAEAQGAMMQAIGAMLQAPTTKGVVDSSSQIVSSAVNPPTLAEARGAKMQAIGTPLSSPTTQSVVNSSAQAIKASPSWRAAMFERQARPPLAFTTANPPTHLRGGVSTTAQPTIRVFPKGYPSLLPPFPAGPTPTPPPLPTPSLLDRFKTGISDKYGAVKKGMADAKRDRFIRWWIAQNKKGKSTTGGPSDLTRFGMWAGDQGRAGVNFGKSAVQTAINIGDKAIGGSVAQSIAKSSKISSALWNLGGGDESEEKGEEKSGMSKMAVGLGIVIAILKKLTESSPILKAVLELFNLGMTLFFMPFGNALGEFILPFMMKFVDLMVRWNVFMSDLPANLGKWFAEIPERIKNWWEGVVSWFTGLRSMFIEWIVGGLLWLWDKLKEAFEVYKKIFFDLPVMIATKIWEFLKQLPALLANAIKGALGMGEGGVISSVKGLLGFAEGGYVPAKPGGTPIIVGEGGKGEFIVPEGSALKAVGGGTTSIINLTISGNVYGVNDLERVVKNAVDDSMNKARYR